MSDAEIQRVGRMQARKALLEAYSEQLKDLARPSAAAAPDQYRLHPEIEQGSGELHCDGHYKRAALEAYIRVIQEVRSKSGLPLDGNNLMNQAFGCDGHAPLILRSMRKKMNNAGQCSCTKESSGFEIQKLTATAYSMIPLGLKNT